MSYIYSKEPPTTAKVTLTTNYGDIDIELWTKEAPRTSRNFLQLCADGYYDQCPFHRIISGFMVQTGDPTGTGEGGQSIWGKPFADEFHSRLRFSYRGMVAMANTNSPNSNGSQFFITVVPANWLDKKHTIFGKVTGETLFNVINISELPVEGERPSSSIVAPQIISVKIVINPFTDIVSKKVEKTTTVIENPNKLFICDSNLISCAEEFDLDTEGIQAVHSVAPTNKLVNLPAVDLDMLNKKADAKREKQENIAKMKSEEPVKQYKTMESNNEEIESLKREIEDMKKGKCVFETEGKSSLLERKKEEFLLKKKRGLGGLDTLKRLDKFQQKLKQNKSNEDCWMNNKLKFHVDSEKAYHVAELSEKINFK